VTCKTGRTLLPQNLVVFYVLILNLYLLSIMHKIKANKSYLVVFKMYQELKTLFTKTPANVVRRPLFGRGIFKMIFKYILKCWKNSTNNVARTS
jgi:hypothetical protein